MRRSIRSLVVLALLLGFVSAAGAGERLKLATTTSTADTGLLDALLPPFEKSANLRVDVIPVGTGKALKLAEAGDVDVVLVHAREQEDAFVASGSGVNRRDVMWNDFVIAGPAADPARVDGLSDPLEAFRAIARAEAPFVSRGDDSGTHQREKKLWTEAGVKPAGKWYLEAGQGMGATLAMAGEKGAYCLSDRATFTAFAGKTGLRLLMDGGPGLVNRYGIIAVSPAKHPGVNYRGAMALIAWVTSPEGQKIIGEFKKGDSVLFHPDAYGGVKP